jgi:hypothetical protein
VVGCCEYGDEPSGSGATELVSWICYCDSWSGAARWIGCKQQHMNDKG